MDQIEMAKAYLRTLPQATRFYIYDEIKSALKDHREHGHKIPDMLQFIKDCEEEYEMSYIGG